MQLYIHWSNQRKWCYSELCPKPNVPLKEMRLLVSADEKEGYPYCADCAKVAARESRNSRWRIAGRDTIAAALGFSENGMSVSDEVLYATALSVSGSNTAVLEAITELTKLAAWVRKGDYGDYNAGDARNEIARAIENCVRALKRGHGRQFSK